MEFFVGNAQIQLKNLTFPFSRDRIPAAVSRLAEAFEQQCDPVATLNQIPICVSRTELDQILEQSQIQSDVLTQQRPPYPRLNPAAAVRCLQGRQRFEAALQVLGPQTWWSVRIFCIPDNCRPDVLLKREINDLSRQTSYSDGELFRRVYAHRLDGEWELANDWQFRLSSNKQRDGLPRLLNEGDMAQSMYELTAYPGLRNGMQLGNIGHHFASHCYEEMGHYLRHVKEVWRKITLSNAEVQRATDDETVEALQGLAPSASRTDSRTIKDLMLSRKLFSAISSPALRDEIEEQLLHVGGVIPSIKTFHETMGYLSIGMWILRKHIVGDEAFRKTTVVQAMQNIWQPQENLIEYAEGQFYPLSRRRDFFLAYHVLFISAIRNFPKLSTKGPILERRVPPIRKGIDESYLKRFLRHAQALGFNSYTIESKLHQLSSTGPPPSPTQASVQKTRETSVQSRSRRPLTSSYHFISRSLFLPQMLVEAEVGAKPSILFIQTDFMRSFFHGFPSDYSSIAMDSTDEITTEQVESATREDRSQQEDGNTSPGSASVGSPGFQQFRAGQERATLQSPAQELRPDNAVLSAAMSALDRRRLPHHEPESPRSLLSPAGQAGQADSECPPVHYPRNSPDPAFDHGESTRTTERGHSSRIIHSTGDRFSQGSTSTGRTIFSPEDFTRSLLPK